MGAPKKPTSRNLSIADPTTTLTDVALAIFSALLGLRLVRSALAAGAVRWGWGLIFLGCAAGLGAAHHGLEPSLSRAGAQAAWKAGLVAMGAASCAFLLGAAREHECVVRRLVSRFAVAKAALYAAWVAANDNFLGAIADYGIALLVIVALKLRLRRTGAAESAAPTVLAALLTVIGSAVQQSGVVLHTHLDANDLFHLTQLVAVWLLYRAGTKMRDA